MRKRWPTEPLPASRRGPIGPVRAPPGARTDIKAFIDGGRLIAAGQQDIEAFDPRFGASAKAWPGLRALAVFLVAAVVLLAATNWFGDAGTTFAIFLAAILVGDQLVHISQRRHEAVVVAFLRAYGEQPRWWWGLHRKVGALNNVWQREAERREFAAGGAPDSGAPLPGDDASTTG